jgi:arginine/lysine/ornithine decarboxylase
VTVAWLYQWGTLLSTLLSFKTDYDKNKPLSRTLPDLTLEHHARYKDQVTSLVRC